MSVTINGTTGISTPAIINSGTDSASGGYTGNLTGNASTASAPASGSQLALQSAKAWVSFGVTYGGTTVAVNSSYNVSSVVRNATGNYTINFSNALATTTYAMMASTTYRFTSTFGSDDISASPQVLNTGSIQIYCSSNAVLYDCEQVNVAIFGN